MMAGGPAVSFRLIGQDAMRSKMDRIIKNFPRQVERALRTEAEVIMTTSKRKFVPVAGNGGALRASGHVEDVKRQGQDVTVSLVYGNSSAPYALAVHQHPSSHSPPSWRGKSIEEINWHLPGTGPKFLFLPMMDAVPGMGRRIGEAVGL